MKNIKIRVLLTFVCLLLGISNIFAAINLPPTASIINITNNSAFTNINNILVQVKSSDPDGTIIRTELYGDTYLIGFSTSSNLNYNWNNIGIGNHNVYARTIDNSNSVFNTLPINFSIISAPPVIIPPISPPVSITNLQGNGISSYVIGRVRNDFSGWLGFKLTVGSKPLTVNSLGRFNHVINTNSHVVKLVSANGTDIASVIVNNANQPTSQFVFTKLANSIVLSNSTAYYLVCQEVAGGDSWGTDSYGIQQTLITTTSDLVNNGPVLNNTGAWTLRSLVNGTFEPLNFKYDIAGQITNTIPTNIPPVVIPPIIPPVSPPTNLAGVFVSPVGTPTATGTINSPIDLQTAFNHPAIVKPGTTIWLRNGNYTHLPQGATASPANQGWIFISKLNGTASNPIIVRSYPGELAVIDGGAWPYLNANARPTINVRGSYTWFMDLEVTSSSNEARFSPDDSSFPASINRSEGPSVYTVGIKFINCIFDNLTTGLSAWGAAGDFEAYGNVIFNNGWQGTPHAHGHNIYTQNFKSSNPKTFSWNFLINAFQNNLQAYGSSAAEVAHFRIDSNISINRPLFVGGRTDCNLLDDQVINNYFYNSDAALVYHPGPNYIDIIVRFNYMAESILQIGAWQQAAVNNNTIISSAGGTLIDIIPPAINKPLPLWNWSGNFYYAPANNKDFVIEGEAFYSFANWKARSGYDNNSSYTIGLPTTNLNVVVKNKYDKNKAFVVIYNWQKLSNLNLDISALGWANGAKYELRSVQDYFGDISNGSILNQKISIDMTAAKHSIALPRGSNAPLGPNTFPNFGGFILINKG